jgi:hypothetical protein
MPTHLLSYIANAVLFSTLMHDRKVTARTKAQYERLMDNFEIVANDHDRLLETVQTSSAQVDYLLSFIKKHNLTDIDEFDLIMLHNLNFTVKETE